MLQRLLTLKVSVAAVLDRDSKKDVRQMRLKDRQWELAKEVVAILDPIQLRFLAEVSMSHSVCCSQWWKS